MAAYGMRLLFTGVLAGLWLIPDYPWGLGLFVACACWHSTLQPSYKVRDKIGAPEVLSNRGCEDAG